MLTEFYKQQPKSLPSDVVQHANVLAVGLNWPSWQLAVDRLGAQGYCVIRFARSADFLDADHFGRVGVLVFDESDEDLTVAMLDYCRLPQASLVPILASRSVDISRAVSVMRAGAFDVVRSPDWEDLYASVREASEWLRAAMSPSRTPVSSPTDWPSLTGRQKEILGRILEGQPNKIIAADLGISQRTAENHRALIMKKMGVSSISNLVKAAVPPPARPLEHPSFAAAQHPAQIRSSLANAGRRWTDS